MTSSTSHSIRYVGIDYHARNLQVCLMAQDGTTLAQRRCRNDLAALDEVVSELSQGHVVRVAIEASTGVCDLADTLVDDLGWDVSLAHPLYVSKLRQSPDKSDLSDAALLADLLRVGYLPRSYHPSASIRELRRLVRHRQSLADQRRAIKLRIRALLRDHRTGAHAPARAWTRAWCMWCQHELVLPETSRLILDDLFDQLDDVLRRIRRIEAALETTTRDDPVVQRLRSHRGVGLVTATVLRAEVVDFSRFRSGKMLSRFCGVSPRNNTSDGRGGDGGLIRAASPKLRSVLIELGWRLIRSDGAARRRYEHLRLRGKPAPLAVAAVVNRWVRSLHTEMNRPMR